MNCARTFHRVALGALVFISLALAGCGFASTATGSITADQITQVRIIHMASAISVGAPLLDKTIHNATTAQRLYNATVALPLFPSGVMNCAADTGETYTLDFTRANATPLDVVAHPSGCQRVTYQRSGRAPGNQRFLDAAQTDHASATSVAPRCRHPYPCARYSGNVSVRVSSPARNASTNARAGDGRQV